MPTLFGVLAQTGPHGPMGPHGPGGGWGGGWMGGGLFPWLGPLGGLLSVLLVAALLGAVVYAAIALARRGRNGDAGTDGDRGRTDDGEAGARGRDDALAVLDRRYARGEIDDEEYEARRERLTGN